MGSAACVSSDACNVPSAWALVAPARPLLQVAGVGPAEYLLPLVGGFAGSMHCVGMCGGFAVAMGAGPGRRRRSVLYNAGRLGTLLGLGALAGTAGAVAVGGGPAATGSRLLALAAGLCMLVIALESLGMAGILGGRLAAAGRGVVAPLLSGVVHSRSAAAPLAFGALNALLPCHLIYAFAAQAAATGSPVAGTMVMGAFALGTMPAMLGLGLAAGRLAPAVRHRLGRLAAVLVLGFAALTIARAAGLPAGHAEHGQEHRRHDELRHADHQRAAE
jgi:sulfite exporter TauE/SafE